MPKGKKYGGRDFLPGNNANPKGRPKKTEELRAIEKAVGDKLADIARLLIIDAQEAATVLRNPNASLLEHFVASALTKRDAGVIFAILDRVLGKPKQRTEIVTERAPIVLSYQNPKISDKPLDIEVEPIKKKAKDGNKTKRKGKKAKGD